MIPRITFTERREGGRTNKIPPTYRFFVLLLICSVMIAPAIGAPNPGHDANQIEGQGFGAGNYSFPDRVGIGVSHTNIKEELIVNGTINASGGINSGAGIDLAESFHRGEDMGPGDIVSAVDADTVMRTTNDTALYMVGVVSTQPGMTLNDPSIENPVHVALTGRVPVKIKGFVQRGDYITVGPDAGVGVRAAQPGFVVGRALHDSNGPTVTILVEPGYFSPQVDVNSTLIGAPQQSLSGAFGLVGSSAVVGHPGLVDRVAAIERQLNVTAILEQRVAQLEQQLAQRDALLAQISEDLTALRADVRALRSQAPQQPQQPGPDNQTTPDTNQTDNQTNQTEQEPETPAIEQPSEFVIGVTDDVTAVGTGDIDTIQRVGTRVVITLT